jgi:cyanate lyase
MATATKGRSATSKARQQSKKAAAAKNGGPSSRELAHKRDLELAPKVLQMRNDGKSWSDIKAKLGVDQPKGQVLIKMASVKPKDRIKADNEKDLAKKVVAARKSGLSWADIAVRAGITMGKVKTLFEQGGGGSAADSRVTRVAEPKAKAKQPARQRGAQAKGKPAGKTKNRRRGAKEAADPSRQG